LAQISESEIVQGPSEITDDETVCTRNVFVVGKRENRSYISFMLPPNGVLVIAEIVVDPGAVPVNANLDDKRLLRFVKAMVTRLLASPSL
jgi:hypothetical protein